MTHSTNTLDAWQLKQILDRSILGYRVIGGRYKLAEGCEIKDSKDLVILFGVAATWSIANSVKMIPAL